MYKINDVNIVEIEREENKITEEVNKLYQAFDSIAINQTDYQTRHFVIAEHDTPERQWWQAVLELQACLANIRKFQLDLEDKELDLEEARLPVVKNNSFPGSTEKSRQRIDIEYRRMEILQKRIHIEIEGINASRLGTIRKAKNLFVIMKEIEKKCNGGKPYTFEQLEAGEKQYWNLRLKRQMLESYGVGSVVGVGNLRSVIGTMMEPGETNPIHNNDNNLIAEGFILGSINPRENELKEGDK